MGFGNLSTRKVIDLLYIGSSRGIVLSCVAVAHIKKDSRLSSFGMVPNQVRVVP